MASIVLPKSFLCTVCRQVGSCWNWILFLWIIDYVSRTDWNCSIREPGHIRCSEVPEHGIDRFTLIVSVQSLQASGILPKLDSSLRVKKWLELFRTWRTRSFCMPRCPRTWQWPVLPKLFLCTLRRQVEPGRIWSNLLRTIDYVSRTDWNCSKREPGHIGCSEFPEHGIDRFTQIISVHTS